MSTNTNEDYDFTGDYQEEVVFVPVQTIELAEVDVVPINVVAARDQVEETRAELTDTIDQIKDRLSPQHLAAEAKEAAVDKAQEVLGGAVDAAREKAAIVTNAIGDAVASAKPVLQNAGETVKGAGVTIVETIKLNPLPAAITGFGLAWLLMSATRHNAASAPLGESAAYDGANIDADRFTSAADEFGGQNNFATSSVPITDLATPPAPSTLDNVKDTLNDARDKVAQTATNVASTVSQKASDLSGQAKDQAQRAVGATGDFFQSHPLAIGAIALLAGAAVGLMIPATEPENRLMGETRDRLKDQAAQQLHQVADKVQNVAQSAYDTAKNTAQQTAREQNLTSTFVG